MASLGDTLRERRASLGISLEKAEAETRIRSRLLAALEQGDYERLPNPGYVRGYITSYARYLQLDPQALLQLYRAETGERRTQDLNLPQIDEAVARTGEQHAIPWRAALSVVALVALVALVAWGAVRFSRGPADLQPEPVPVTGDQTETPTPQETPTPGEEASDSPSVKPFTLVVQVSDEGASWLRVTVDGKKAYEGTLAGGQSKTYEVAGTAAVRVGMPSAVTVLKDGVPVPIPEGDTPTVNLKADTAE